MNQRFVDHYTAYTMSSMIELLLPDRKSKPYL